MRRLCLLLCLLLCACAGPAVATPTATPASAPSASGVPSPSPGATTATGSPADAAAEQAAVAQVVLAFGQALKQVSVQAPDDTVRQSIADVYGPLVAPELLARWMSQPGSAPGRVVSSPWPERIEILELARETPRRYTVTGMIIEVTSVELARGGAAARVPVRLTLEQREGRWLITDYQAPAGGS